MARKTKAAVESLGTFDEEQARAIADMLNTKEIIHADVERLFVGEKNEQPTEWWHVNVPSRSMVQASAWLRGYRAGVLFNQAMHHKCGRDMTFSDAVRALGYSEYVSPEDKQP